MNDADPTPTDALAGTVVVGSARRRAAVSAAGAIAVALGVAALLTGGGQPAERVAPPPKTVDPARSSSTAARASTTTLAARWDTAADDQAVLSCLQDAGVSTERQFVPFASGFPSPGALARVVHATCPEAITPSRAPAQ